MKDWIDDNKDFNECAVRIVLDAPQDSRTGYILNKILYGSMYGYGDLYELAPGASGCPHHGGSHAMTVTGSRQDVNSWIDMVAEEFPDWEYCAIRIKRQLRKEFLEGSWRKFGRVNIHLAKLEILEPVVNSDRAAVRKWFDHEWENVPRKEYQPSRRDKERVNKANPALAKRPW